MDGMEDAVERPLVLVLHPRKSVHADSNLSGLRPRGLKVPLRWTVETTVYGYPRIDTLTSRLRMSRDDEAV